MMACTYLKSIMNITHSVFTPSDVLLDPEDVKGPFLPKGVNYSSLMFSTNLRLKSASFRKK